MVPVGVPGRSEEARVIIKAEVFSVNVGLIGVGRSNRIWGMF